MSFFIVAVTFFELVVGGDVLPGAPAHRLGADVSTHRPQVTPLLQDLHVTIVFDHPTNPVTVDLGENELGVVAQVDVAFLDGFDRCRPALHQRCTNNLLLAALLSFTVLRDFI